MPSIQGDPEASMRKLRDLRDALAIVVSVARSSS